MGYRVLVVCSANLCRSPMAQGVLESMLRARGLGDRITVDSAGTHATRAGAPPDALAQAAATAHGLDIGALRSRPVTPADLEASDLVLAMDRQNLHHLRYLSPAHARDRLRLFLEFRRGWRMEVPDPVGSDPRRFAQAMTLIQRGARGVVEHLAATVARG